MRRHQQQQILQLINTLFEATKELETMCKSNADVNEWINLLSDCQQFAISVCDYIESLEGEETRTECLFEDYCKALYEASLDSPKINHTDAMESILHSIVASVKEEFKPDKMLALFLPYKASMADALETIWESALADDFCDVVVCPIPYFDKNSDGTLGKMHYEGDSIKGVEIADWQKINIEELHPDVIFVHNPYDNGNLVTTIHPNFYCKKIKDYTDLLVYVPYFVAQDKVAPHLCVTAGSLNADIVVTQSKKINDMYIAELKKFEEEKNMVGALGNLEERFLPLGSPKLDKILTLKEEDFTLPEKWEQLIYAKGKRKSIILLNTALSDILKFGEKYLKKLKATLEVFKGRNDVVLWWRPHPLCAQTYDSMRGEIAQEYHAIVDEYKKDGYGIYDDTTDLERSIIFCDAYFGGWSSVISLVWAVNKPIMRMRPTLLYPKTDASFDYHNGLPKNVGWGYENMKGIYTGVFIESPGYSLHDLMNDLADNNKHEEILDFVMMQNKLVADEQFANIGTAGENIYKVIKEKYIADC